jgi:acyl-coenzyme A synthetase/AMP-(fatty) acid ligase
MYKTVHCCNADFLLHNTQKKSAILNVNYEIGTFHKYSGLFHCLQIAHFKIPRYIRFMADFPKTVSGKIQKFQLQKMVLEEVSRGTG